MFKELRRKDRKLETEEAIELLKNGAYGILSTVGENGYAYGVPLSYVYTNDVIYFHSAVEGQKLSNLLKNNKVSFCVVGKTCTLPDKFSTEYESVIVFGKASEVFDSEKHAVFLEVINKYSSNYIEEGKAYIEKLGHVTRVIKIDIDHISGKAKR